MSVLIGIACAEQARSTLFYKHLERLERPEGSRIEWSIGNNIAMARNNLCEAAIAQNFDHLFFLDDDHEFAPGTLTRLLEDDLDIVSGLYLMRKWPFTPVAFASWKNEANQEAWPLVPKAGVAGLYEVVAVGAGCLLIKTDALRRIGPPWFTLLSPVNHDKISEDFNFCVKAAAAGVKIVVDTDVIVGHASTMALWPWRDAEGVWSTCILSNGERLHVPNAQELTKRKAAKEGK